jgi:uncharacterized phage protein gp47/JayE
MTVYLKKTKSEILSTALDKLQTYTSITSLGPGSVARSLTEAITSEIGDLYDILDFNLTQTYLSTASGTALNSIGELYGVERKEVPELAVIDKALGSFFFYIDSPSVQDIVIPNGTNIYTSAVSYVGIQHSFSTVSETRIPAGSTRSYVSIQPNFNDTVYSAGRGTLIFHDAQPVNGSTIFSTNPKTIAPLPGFESDNDYRLRIIKQIRVNTAGTTEAVRFAGLSVSNVRDVKIRQAPYGMGSFEAIVVPEQGNNRTQTINNARAAMEAVRPLGTRMFVKAPSLLPVDIKLAIFIPGVNESTVSDNLKSRALIGVRRYLGSLLPGQPLVYNRVVQIVLESNNYITDVSISSMTINGSRELNKNYQPKDDEQLTAGNIVVNIGSN